MRAELVRVGLHQVDIKIVTEEGEMHVLQWRRNLLWDEVLLDGKRQGHSGGFGREKCYGLVFGKRADGTGGTKVMLLLDPSTSYGNWGNPHQQIAGVRLETADGPIVAFGTLDPKNLQKPATFSDWMKKSMGMEWGDERRPH
ncbi:MAG TPA: hypothetical protein EYG02_13815 [Henriciella marina]|uniref:hypothetical protein n=1 Tax=Henriciella sp. TaxID=1968823 RepID=UPI001840F2E2|nr:hypothetical protein [Henriciella sp.]HIG22834.1 hypothetical protein [Henriciella sp.]HIK66086.1 hypothetical protein [Henriciella marina]